MASLGQDVDPTKPAGNFGMGVQQMIEITKGGSDRAKMIIMDEPTSSLGEKEVEQLMKTCRELKARAASASSLYPISWRSCSSCATALRLSVTVSSSQPSRSISGIMTP